MSTKTGEAGIVVDDWKLPIFRKHLTDAGYTYEDAGGLTAATTVLKVPYTNMLHLKEVVEAAQEECRRQGPPKSGKSKKPKRR